MVQILNFTYTKKIVFVVGFKILINRKHRIMFSIRSDKLVDKHKAAGLEKRQLCTMVLADISKGQWG
jgi:hypothetical protein